MFLMTIRCGPHFSTVMFQCFSLSGVTFSVVSIDVGCASLCGWSPVPLIQGKWWNKHLVSFSFAIKMICKQLQRSQHPVFTFMGLLIAQGHFHSQHPRQPVLQSAAPSPSISGLWHHWKGGKPHHKSSPPDPPTSLAPPVPCSWSRDHTSTTIRFTDHCKLWYKSTRIWHITDSHTLEYYHWLTWLTSTSCVCFLNRKKGIRGSKSFSSSS